MKNRTLVGIRAAWVLATVGVVSITPSVHAGPPFFRGLGALHQDNPDTFAYGLSADGAVVLGSSGMVPADIEATSWGLDRVPVGLGDFSGGYYYGRALDASADGSVIVGQSASMFPPKGHFHVVYEAFMWTPKAGMISLGDLPGGIFDSTAFAISDDATVVVGQAAGENGSEPFRWTAADGMVGLGTLPGGDAASGRARDISADGSVIVGETRSPNTLDPSSQEAFRWTQDDGMIALGDLPGGRFSSTAHAVSADGTTIVGFSSYTSHPYNYDYQAFRWTAAEGMVGLGFVGEGSLSTANAVSADGSIIVGATAILGRVPSWRAFIWDAKHGMRDLQTVLEEAGVAGLDQWELESAVAISADGRTIAGTGWHPRANRNRAWVVRFDYPTCIADWNNDDVVNSQDYFNFLVAFFAQAPSANVNNDGVINSQDFFDFLAAFFVGCEN